MHLGCIKVLCFPLPPRVLLFYSLLLPPALSSHQPAPRHRQSGAVRARPSSRGAVGSRRRRPRHCDLWTGPSHADPAPPGQFLILILNPPPPPPLPLRTRPPSNMLCSHRLTYHSPPCRRCLCPSCAGTSAPSCGWPPTAPTRGWATQRRCGECSSTTCARRPQGAGSVLAASS